MPEVSSIEAVQQPDGLDRFLGKIPVQNLWYLLLYAWELAEFKDKYRSTAEEAPSLKALFVRLFIQISYDLIRQGIHRSYIPAKARLQGIKGRILFSESIKQNAFQQQQVVCQFTHFDENNLLNQLIKATLQSLVLWLRRQDAAENRELIQALIALQPYFRNVEHIQLYPGLFQLAVVHRNNRAYQLLIQLCRMIYQATMPTENHGADAFLRVMKDQLTGHKLYERFLKQFYTLHMPSHKVFSEKLHWPADPVSDFMPSMMTDITLHPKTSEWDRIVMDAKWYADTLVSYHRGGKDRFHTGHLYQLYAYLRTQEEEGDEYQNAKGILLYPTVTQEVHEEFMVQGHPVKIATLNLSRPWAEIEASLMAVVHFGLSVAH